MNWLHIRSELQGKTVPEKEKKLSHKQRVEPTAGSQLYASVIY